MLYDKRWDKSEVKADPFSLESLIAWLEKQPATKRYDWENCDGGCLIGLYGQAHGISWDAMQRVDDGGDSPYSKLTPGGIAFRYPRTFGAALKRARKALAERA
jgi:hypothetical protein